jgi:transposase
LARREFAVVDVTEMLKHWYAGRPKNELARSLGVDVKTARKYITPAEAAGLSPGGPPISNEEWSRLAAEWWPNLVDHGLRRYSWKDIAVFHDRIEEWLGECSIATIHQRLRDEEGLAVSVASVRRYAGAHFAERGLREKVTVRKDDPPPGQEAQVDYGYLGRWFDPAERRFRRIWAFVMVLATSRHMFVRPVISMDQRAWSEAHVAAFRFFGGVPARLVPDNLATGVSKPDLYDPQLNRAYAELADHYGVLIDPARRAKPKDKPRVERPMQYVRDSFWAGRDFDSLEAMQAAAVVWCRDVAGRRECRPLRGAAPLIVFEAVEQPMLRALPARPFEIAGWSRPKVGPDIHAKVGKTLYSIPWRLIGQTLDAREGDRTVEFHLNGQLVKTHRRTSRGKQTDWNDYPPEKVAYLMRTPVWCRARAAEIGPSCAQLVAELLALNALYRIRSAQGVVGLVERYPAERVDAACARALAVGDPTYRTVKGILVAGTELDGSPTQTVVAAPAFLRGQDAIFDVEAVTP